MSMMRARKIGHRNCVVIGCTNSWRQLNSWMQHMCEEHGCYKGSGSCVCPEPFILFPFPTERKPERRQAWIRNIKRESDDKGVWKPKMDHRVCSKHFADGAPSEKYPDPILHMGYKSTTLPTPRRTLKRSNQQTSLETRQANDDAPEVPEVMIPDQDVPVSSSTVLDHSYTTPSSKAKVQDCFCSDDVCECCSGCLEKASQIRSLKDRVKHLENLLKMKTTAVKVEKKKTVFETVITSDRKAKFYTGMPSVQMFDMLYNFLWPKVSKMRYWRGQVNTTQRIIRKYKGSPKKFGPKRKLPIKDELLLTLMKICLGLLEQDLADRFSISVSQVSSVFTTWIRLLSKELKGMLKMPPKENIRSNLPKDAALFPNLRCIIDCTEVFIERPRELSIQAVTWSDYKKHNTAKLLIGITPRGKICYLSYSYGGRVSDVHVVNTSGFLNLIDPYDEVLADKGFTIENQLLLRGAKLIIPPGVKGQRQMLPEEVSKTKKVANFRIHVERAIGRLKEFRILNGTYAINMLPVLDDVLVTCSALCNFLPPLVTSEYLYN